ncbi:helix-turn-helix protein [Panacagrimonas perspica]|uniref:Helix-turn-helix protein n=1 Tax=Panacagrimonas perspica TaxID=381431 RepID=A0A4R7P6F8_9GAMM|nr:helix-turn-helix domain-containing protein [Panacagrimonas perspica]TDU28861.1 helix-turn-helix protein [Panacagrimonas perspica]THD02310.1 hypothetical protein B1810_15400 [Panacagrimonas perspica]
MASIAAALKEEIVRLAKKVLKQGMTPVSAATARHRRDIAELKRSVAALEKELKQLRKGTGRPTETPSAEVSSMPIRFQAKGLRSLRARLDLSASEMGRLIGVSAQTVYNWETEKSLPRRAQLESLAAVRHLGKKEAAARLSSGA